TTTVSIVAIASGQSSETSVSDTPGFAVTDSRIDRLYPFNRRLTLKFGCWNIYVISQPFDSKFVMKSYSPMENAPTITVNKIALRRTEVMMIPHSTRSAERN
ncbi:hypothetical protein LSAT2_006722, partial [Lamellibrachia satsuma]